MPKRGRRPLDVEDANPGGLFRVPGENKTACALNLALPRPYYPPVVVVSSPAGRCGGRFIALAPPHRARQSTPKRRNRRANRHTKNPRSPFIRQSARASQHTSEILVTARIRGCKPATLSCTSCRLTRDRGESAKHHHDNSPRQTVAARDGIPIIEWRDYCCHDQDGRRALRPETNDHDFPDRRDRSASASTGLLATTAERLRILATSTTRGRDSCDG